MRRVGYLLRELVCRLLGHRTLTIVDHKPSLMTEIDVCRRCHRPLETREIRGQYPLPRDPRAFVR